MIWYYIKSALFFTLFAVIFSGIIIVNYFHVSTNLLPQYLPQNSLLFASIAVVVLSLFLFWKKDFESERAKNQFVAIVTHKFRTPLTGMKWAIESLKNNLSYQQKDAVLVQIENSNQMILEIIDTIVGFSEFNKSLSYAYEATSLREIVDISLQKYANQIKNKTINFKINSGNSLPLVITDKRKIQFVVDVLIDNAIKYTPDGGLVEVDFNQRKNFLIMSVKDNGIGIKWSDRSKIFKRFYRARNAQLTYTDGIGLGLNIAKTIIKKHHGDIWFSSQGINKGSVFYLALKIK